MVEKFYQPLQTKVRLDSQRVPRDLIHERHFVSDARTARHAAQDYLGKFRHLIGTKAEELNSLNRRPERDVTDAGVEYRFHAEKPLPTFASPARLKSIRPERVALRVCE